MSSFDKMLTSSGGNVFRLARIAMLRAVEINMGSPSLVERSPQEKESTLAMREMAEGRLTAEEKFLDKK